MNECAGQGKLLLHPPGEGACLAILEFFETGEAQHLGNAGWFALLFYLLDISKEVQIFKHAQIGIQAKVLRHIPDLLSQGIGIPAGVEPHHVRSPA